MATRKEALLPCPFCGDTPKYSYSDFFERHSYGCANIMCSFNPSDNSHNYTKAEAIKAWNTRALSPPPDEVTHKFARYADVLAGQKTNGNSVIIELWDIQLTKQDFIDLRNHIQGGGSEKAGA